MKCLKKSCTWSRLRNQQNDWGFSPNGRRRMAGGVEREGGKEKETDRQTDRQRRRERDRQTDREGERETETEREEIRYQSD